ncbi:MAG: SDR family oxidoreductase [Rhizobiaceae bacterium]|jgi:NAD(P)-dependent dehydrogenase (short-subunit alcohol dehydrogenase family)
MSGKGVCVVIGAGDDTGAAIARAFAREGLIACVVRRPRHLDKLEALAAEIRAEGNIAHAFGVDARDEQAMASLFGSIEDEIGPIEVAIFNIGANVRFPIVETTARVYRKVWEMAAFAGFLTGREAARHMLPRERGTILFTGATASMRGGDGFSAFAGAKHALRALAQSMARELGPKNIHVAHIVIDGAIDTNFIRGMRPDVDDLRERDAILSPDAIAAAYVALHRQHRSAWTHEMDLRPWAEKW